MVRFALATLLGASLTNAQFDDENGLLQMNDFQVEEQKVMVNQSQSTGTGGKWGWISDAVGGAIDTVGGWFSEPSPPEAEGALAACLLDNRQRTWHELIDMSLDDRRNTVIVFLANEGFDSVGSLQGKTNGHLVHLCPQRADAQRVYIGPSGDNQKCVTQENVVECMVSAGDHQQRLNMDFHNAGDRFAITSSNGQVCARRLDVNHGWGMKLEVRCSTKPLGNLFIGPSHHNHKCVNHGGIDAALKCAANAGDRGNRVNLDHANAPDTFQITVPGNGQVCAQRTDSSGGWGMQLQIQCEEDLENCDERLHGDRDAGYRGCQDRTVQGTKCQKWTEQSPNKHNRHPESYPNKGLGDHNFCRNPDGEPNIWCYTADNWQHRWNFCTPRKYVCDETYEGDGSGYRGCTDVTHTGKTCMRWSSQSPHQHTRTAAEYPNMGIGFHNYCRNPDGEPRIWCYTTDEGTRWDFCDHPAVWCDAVKDCSNHGTTKDKDNTDGCICQCTGGYSGPDCSTPPPCSADDHCSGHGTTDDADATNGCDCTCSDDYRGSDCSIPPACSSEHHCNGHATLDMDSTDGCECHCSDGWSGVSCKVPPRCKADTDCSGHGQTIDADSTDGCDCKCAAGWTGKDCSVPEKVCCRAMTVDCLACAADMSASEYCEKHPSTVGCKPDPKPPQACCRAMIPECLACQAGLSKEEYCKTYPAVEGCRDDDIIDDC